jgi:hypothetical protein
MGGALSWMAGGGVRFGLRSGCCRMEGGVCFRWMVAAAAWEMGRFS